MEHVQNEEYFSVRREPATVMLRPVERQADRLQPVVALVKMQDLILTDQTVVVADDPALDLDTHARPKGCLCWRVRISADGTAPRTIPDLPHFIIMPLIIMPPLRS
jgi:hypothetical protein